MDSISLLCRRQAHSGPSMSQTDIHTLYAGGTQQVGALDLTARRALCEGLHIFQGLARHLPVTPFGMRGFLLGHSSENRFPDVGQ